MKKSYTNDAVIVRVVDGDTFEADVDLGYRLWRRGKYRINGINANEHNAPGGPEAKAHLESLLPAGLSCTLISYGGYKFGQDGEYMADIILPSAELLSMRLVAEHWAAPYDGTDKRELHLPPWPRPEDTPTTV